MARSLLNKAFKTLMICVAFSYAVAGYGADFQVKDLTVIGKGCQYTHAGGLLRTEASLAANILSIGFSKYGEHVDLHIFEADFRKDRTDADASLAHSDCALTFTVARTNGRPFRLTTENFVLDYIWEDEADAFDAHAGMRITEIGNARNSVNDFKRIFGPKDGQLGFEFANQNFRTRCRSSHRIELAFSFQLGGYIEPDEDINSQLYYNFFSEWDTYVEECD